MEVICSGLRKELLEALIVKARGLLGGDEDDLNDTILLNRVRTNHEWLAILGMGSRSEACGDHHGNARSETCGWHQDAEFTRH